MEVMYPLFRLQEAGWQVDIAAPKIEEIHTGKNISNKTRHASAADTIISKYCTPILFSKLTLLNAHLHI